MHQKPTKTCITSAEFGRLYSDYNPRFTEVTYRYVRDRGIAEDLVSDSFMAFWEERDRLPVLRVNGQAAAAPDLGLDENFAPHRHETAARVIFYKDRGENV